MGGETMLESVVSSFIKSTRGQVKPFCAFVCRRLVSGLNAAPTVRLYSRLDQGPTRMVQKMMLFGCGGKILWRQSHAIKAVRGRERVRVRVLERCRRGKVGRQIGPIC